jgi:hypothetical protein
LRCNQIDPVKHDQIIRQVECKHWVHTVEGSDAVASYLRALRAAFTEKAHQNKWQECAN